MLEVGTKAPDFTLQNQEGKEVSLKGSLPIRLQREESHPLLLSERLDKRLHETSLRL